MLLSLSDVLGMSLGTLGGLEENGDSGEEMLAEEMVFLGLGVRRIVKFCRGEAVSYLILGCSLD